MPENKLAVAKCIDHYKHLVLNFSIERGIVRIDRYHSVIVHNTTAQLGLQLGPFRFKL